MAKSKFERKRQAYTPNGASFTAKDVGDAVGKAMAEQEDRKLQREQQEQYKAAQQSKWQADAKARDSRLKPKAYVKSGSQEESEYLDDLRDKITETNVDYMDFVSEHANLNEKGELDTTMDMMNRYYMHGMMLACTQPLQQGVNPTSIVQCLGMRIGMCMVNPDFRKECGKAQRDLLYPVVDKLAQELPENSKLAEYRDKIIKEQNHGRIPFSPESAALTELGMIKRAYEDMREPGANVDEIMTNFNKAQDVLRAQAHQDGVSTDELELNERLIVGQMIEKNPELAIYFEELTHDGVKREGYHDVVEMVQGPNGPEQHTKKVWSGEFQNDDGTLFTKGFTPRKPMSKDGHQKYMNDVYDSKFVDKSYPEMCSYVHSGEMEEMLNTDSDIHSARQMYMDDCGGYRYKVKNPDGSYKMEPDENDKKKEHYVYAQNEDAILDIDADCDSILKDSLTRWAKAHEGEINFHTKQQQSSGTDYGKIAEEKFQNVLRQDGQIMDTQFT